MSKKAAIFFSVVFFIVLCCLLVCEKIDPEAGTRLVQAIFGR